MGALKKILVKLGLKSKKSSLLVIGLDNGGKTTIINNLKADKQENSEVTPTVGFTVETFKLNKVKMTVMDMSGQAKYQKLWKCYYNDAKALMFVIDAADSSRFEEAKTVLCDVFADESIRKLPLLVFANKSDLPEACQAVEVSEKIDLIGTLHAQRAWHIQASSAITGEGVEEGMKWLLSRV